MGQWQFSEPAQGGGGDRFTAEEAQNRRLIVVPIEYVPEIKTARGEMVDGIRVNVVDLDGEGGQPKVYRGALWFGGKLIQAFRPKIGDLHVGYLGKQRTAGGFQAWVFTSLTQDQTTLGMATTFMQNTPDFMEDAMADIAQAQAATMTRQEQNQQRQQQPPWGNQQQQWGQPGPSAPPQPPQFRPPPAPPVGGPIQQGPPPLPPQSEQDPWPAQSYQGNGAPGTAPASAPPAPVGGSVMDRLRAQRDSGQAGPAQGDMPF